MISNNRIVWKFFNAKATDAKKVIYNLCSNEFSRGSDEKIFSFDFNIKAVCLIRVCSWSMVLILLSMVYTFFSFDLPSCFFARKATV